MRKQNFIAALSALALAACGSPEPAAENLDTANLALNAMIANEVAVANDVADVPEAEPEAPAAPAPAQVQAPAPKAPKPPAPTPAPKPAEPKAPDPAPACAPEHRAAGHC